MLFSALLRAQPPSSPPETDEERQDRGRRIARVADRYLGSVWRTARDLGVPGSDVEDVVQEVMVVLVRRFDDIEVGRERAFLLATTSRVVANLRRRGRRRPAKPSAELEELESDTRLHGARALSPAETAERSQELAILRAALDAMTEAQRVAFTLFELEQMSGREIAESLGASEAVVFARVRRGRAVFKRFCERYRAASSKIPGKRG